MNLLETIIKLDDKMSIGQRIGGLVVLMVLAISAIGGYAVLQSLWNASAVKVVTENVVPSALASADLVSRLKDVQLATMNLVSAPDDSVVQATKERLDDRRSGLQIAVDLQSRQADNKTQQGLVRQMQESLQNYFQAIDETAKFRVAGQKEMAEATLSANVAQYQTELEQIVETLRVEKNRSKDQAITTLNTNLSRTVTTLSTITLLFVVVLVVICVVLYRVISLPINRMQRMMTEIATSQDFTRRVPIDRHDEIGRSVIAFNIMIEKIQERSELLREKTADIHTMLQNMPQGILTITGENQVHPEYSAYLETILETKDIAGRNVMELLFANTNLSSDTLAQVRAIAGACIGEDVMNFEFNQHLMVGEIEKQMPDGRVKILDLNWSPITDDTGTTMRLLVCVRDVTDLRELTLQANEQRRELEIIGEILSVSHEKFHEFIIGALQFIDENELIIHQHPERNIDVIAELFRNMHTIKGNARTYGLRHITNIVHEAEQTYDELRKSRPNIVWDQGVLQEELARVKIEVDYYAKVNETTLGRKGPGRRGNVERYVMVEKEKIQEVIHHLERANTNNLHELLATRNTVRKALRLLGTEPLHLMLSEVLDSLPSLAIELGKVPPVVEIEDNGYLLHNQIGNTLKNVFMHLCRNAVDHGIETAEVRSAKGKPTAGTITIRMHVVNGMLQIRLSDDGGGLALAKVRQTAIARGLISPDAECTDEEVARQIFKPGFSTAATVSEVSGRGVGMDAALHFIDREHGKLDIRFTDNATGSDFRKLETIVYLPASVAVHSEGHDYHHAGRSSEPLATLPTEKKTDKKQAAWGLL